MSARKFIKKPASTNLRRKYRCEFFACLLKQRAVVQRACGMHDSAQLGPAFADLFEYFFDVASLRDVGEQIVNPHTAIFEFCDLLANPLCRLVAADHEDACGPALHHPLHSAKAQSTVRASH